MGSVFTCPIRFRSFEKEVDVAKRMMESGVRSAESRLRSAQNRVNALEEDLKQAARNPRLQSVAKQKYKDFLSARAELKVAEANLQKEKKKQRTVTKAVELRIDDSRSQNLDRMLTQMKLTNPEELKRSAQNRARVQDRVGQLDQAMQIVETDMVQEAQTDLEEDADQSLELDEELPKTVQEWYALQMQHDLADLPDVSLGKKLVQFTLPPMEDEDVLIELESVN